MIELEVADSPSTSRVTPFGTFPDPKPFADVEDASQIVDNSGTDKAKVKLISHVDSQDVPPRAQTANDRERMDAGKQALRELLKDRKVKKSKKTSCGAILKLYITILAALMIIGGLLVLIFLVPMTIDPALATLNYDIDYEPAICLTMYAKEVNRSDENMWCSCSEGCTKDIFICQQIVVNYRMNFLRMDEHLQGKFNKTAYYSKIGKKRPTFVDDIDEKDLPRSRGNDKCQNENWVHYNECWNQSNASLYVNVKGCGYPPDVDCDTFLESYSKTGRRFLCYYSKLDRNIVIINYDPTKPWDDLIQSLAWTCGAQAVGIVVIFLLHCPIRTTFKNMCQKKEKVKLMKMGRNKNWKDRVKPPAFQRDWYDVHT